MDIQWEMLAFEELDVHKLYALLRLRSEVFVVEQECIFLDPDNKDQYCHHLLGWQNGILVASTRLVPAGISYPEISIGRVVSSSLVRRTGMGKTLMEKTIAGCYQLWGKAPIRIGAQCYLEKFYHSLGFVAEGETYLEDGIPHIEMVKKPS